MYATLYKLQLVLYTYLAQAALNLGKRISLKMSRNVQPTLFFPLTHFDERREEVLNILWHFRVDPKKSSNEIGVLADVTYKQFLILGNPLLELGNSKDFCSQKHVVVTVWWNLYTKKSKDKYSVLFLDPTTHSKRTNQIDQAERHDFWPWLWLFFSPFLFPSKKRGKKKRRMNSKNCD